MEQAKNLTDAPSKDAPSPVVSTPPPEAARRTRDLVFYSGLVLVSVALGLALHVNLDLAPMMAAAIVLPTAMCLLLAHKLQRRAQSLRALEVELAELRRVSPAARLGRDTRPDAAMLAVPVRPGAAASATTGQANAPGGRGSPLAAGATTAGQAPRVTATMGPPLPLPSSRDMSAMPPTLAGNGRGQPQPVPPSVSGAAGKPRSDGSLPGSGGPAMPPSILPSLPMAPVSGAQVADALMGTYWGHRPGMQPEPTLASPVTAFAAQLAHQKQTPEGESRRPGPPAGPIGSAADLGPGPDERELETMQNLIQQLAVQLNAPKEPEKSAETASLEKLPASGPDVPKPERPQFELTKVEPVKYAPAKAEFGRSDVTEIASGKSEPDKPETMAPAMDASTASGMAASTDAALSDSVAALRAAATTMRETPEPPAPTAHRTPATPPPLPPASRYGELARVTEAVAADRIDVYLDPILGLSDRKARLFEVSVRVLSSDGDVLDPAAIREIASGTGLLARIDAAKLACSARVAGRLKARGTNASLYSNLASESLADEVFLDTFEDAIATETDLPKRLVLSFTQADVRAFNDVHWETVATMAEIGLRFALEDVADLDMDFEKLKSSGFEFVKLDAPMFLEGLPAADGAIPAADLCRHLSGLGLSLIVGAIEDEMSLAKVLGFGVLFGQGTIFGGPRAVQLDPVHQQTAAA